MRHTFKTLATASVLALALGMMAFGTTAAQAEPGAHWDVEGGAISGVLLPEIQAKNDSVHHTFLTTVGKTPVEILCKAISFKGAKLHELGRFTGKIHYDECVTILNKTGTPVNNCKPHSPGASAGLLETNLLDGLLKLHTLKDGSKDDLLELLPTTGTAIITPELGPLCAIGNKFDITGTLFLEDCLRELLVPKKEHLLKEGPLTALLFGTNPMTIDGSFWAYLVGKPHEGMTFRGIAF